MKFSQSIKRATSPPCSEDIPFMLSKPDPALGICCQCKAHLIASQGDYKHIVLNINGSHIFQMTFYNQRIEYFINNMVFSEQNRAKIRVYNPFNLFIVL